MEEMTYSIPRRINFYNCDKNRNLSLRSYLEWSGEMGNLHLEERGVTWQAMMEGRQAFLLSRLAYKRFAPITYGMQCTFTTWEWGVKGPQFIRNYTLYGEGGEVLAQSSSAWILVDPVDRKILRPNQCTFPRKPTGVEVEPKIQRFRLGDLPELGRHIVTPSQIDCNGHLGNQYYADLFKDFAPGGLGDAPVIELQLAFDHEALLGEELILAGEQIGQRGFSMRATLPDGRRCFEALVETGE